MLVVVVYLAWHRYAHGYWPEYNVKRLVLGIGFLVLGICFFVVQEWWPPYYGYNHTYWHACDGIGVTFMVGIRPRTSQADSSRGSAYPIEKQVPGSSIFAPLPRRPQRFSQKGSPLASIV